MFDEVFISNGIEVLRSPPQAPRSNAYAERWVRTVRRECLDRMLIYSPRHLLAVLGEFVDHYNEHRPHQSRGRRPPNSTDTGPAVADLASARVRRRKILIGLISELAGMVRIACPSGTRFVASLGEQPYSRLEDLNWCTISLPSRSHHRPT